MSTIFTSNVGFDIAVVALILFITWFYLHARRGNKHVFKWLVYSILALILSTIIISYNSGKISTDSSQADQNQYEIKALTQKIKEMKGGDGDRLRIVNQADANQAKDQAQRHHHAKVDVVAKANQVKGTHVLARGVHSNQQFALNLSTKPNVDKNEFIVSKGHTTSVKDVSGKATVEVKAKTAKQQTNNQQ